MVEDPNRADDPNRPATEGFEGRDGLTTNGLLRRGFLRTLGVGLGIASLDSIHRVAQAQTSYPVVLEDWESTDLSRYSGEKNWERDDGTAGGYEVTQKGSEVLEGNASLKAHHGEHGGYHTIVTLDETVKQGDTLACKVYYPLKNTYTSVLFGVQSESYPFPTYRWRFDNGGSPTFSLEKVTSSSPIESHNLPDENILYSYADETNAKSKPPAGEYTLEWEWNDDGSMPFTVYDSSGSIWLEDTPDLDTTYSSGGIGFMHSTSDSNEDDANRSYWDEYVILSSDSDGTSNSAPTASDDTASVNKGQTATIDVLSNDSDSDGSLDGSTVTIASSPSNGTAAVNSDGTIDYTHDGSDTASDSFTYTVDDDDGATSNEATVTLTISKTVKVSGDGSATYNDSGVIRYIIETSGTIKPGGTGDLEAIDKGGGSNAAGRVSSDGSNVDTFELSGGKITDVSTWGGDVTVTVDGSPV